MSRLVRTIRTGTVVALVRRDGAGTVRFWLRRADAQGAAVDNSFGREDVACLFAVVSSLSMLMGEPPGEPEPAADVGLPEPDDALVRAWLRRIP